MTITFGVDDNNDLFLDSANNLTVLSGLPAIIQACETATKAQLGEMVLENQKGIPTFQTIWVGSPNYSTFSTYLRNTLLAVPGVLEVSSLEISTSGDVLNYTAQIKTQFGTGNLNG